MPQTNPTPKLVIFDCDGVLVDSETLSNQVLVDNLARYGLHISLDRSMELFVGGTMKGVMQKARSLGADLPADWVSEVYDETYTRLRQGVALVPGIPELLATLKEVGIAFCVASNGSEEKMQITLGQNGLWELFHPHAMFSAHSLGVAKPDPDLFLAAASHFDVQARDCVVIEDSANGALAAARAGMRCLGYAPHDNAASLKSHGAELFHHMKEVPTLIGLS
ncbi:haloacid dehalogenase superfamily, subfamily IA, variant 3 with third motif having DD or ED/haloacid dehalogenase superfamily, subfamily IA, variant 1 with third motif having Dx(3-4)D or Dx(3-4)E [Epibacterium ulvae]|uniref:Haloacid dehalogenase superfamily, subfamily IA, variant 3 with third motif having DD or ED/haloacid dehalogenase superfamily, subfamily IA, variant 1 with third motif having Dx(3-4)D or Dx(3-4)E n=1 Tax=Epibacterium ulvae TaxID=1156985 RepID=A0A1G5R5T7_9RHOB|nr:HAD family phosphatase [Epibacterium ulvae]SCZ69453.1 haloacid dehalogenase superfamily, subfamily IA, variant 3 with third motif having DD or ED/haloacid dehalogenase superfamily, subfamily IA, variant 1 with third motif having Dx(3-4)D or Dx(3-4)E [Epibacterium ulvae]